MMDEPRPADDPLGPRFAAGEQWLGAARLELLPGPEEASVGPWGLVVALLLVIGGGVVAGLVVALGVLAAVWVL